MKRRIKAIIACIVTLCLTAGILKYTTDLMERKASASNYADFFAQDEDFDVLFMGSSHVINGVYPLELWNDYGIISYNFGGHGNRIPTTYWQLENALDYTTPKVVVIDCYLLNEDAKCDDTFTYLHLSFDAFPLTLTKINSINDLLDDPFFDESSDGETSSLTKEARSKLGLLWDFSVYHSRWSEIGQGDFEPGSSYEKGAYSRIALTRCEFNRIDKSEKIVGGTVGEAYLRKMIEDCQSRGIDVLLTYIPFSADEECQMEANYCADVANDYGINYINFLDLDLINYQTDLHDAGHLNPSGGRKVTDYLGSYLMENYGLSDQRNNESYSQWYTDYEEYTAMKDENLASQEELETYLMLLSNDDVDITMDIRNKRIFNNDGVLELLGNLGVDVAAIDENTDFIIITGRGKQTVALDSFRENSSSTETAIGNIQLIYNDESKEYYSLLVDGIEYLESSNEDDADMQICVRRNGDIVDNVKFNYIINPDNNNLELSTAQR